MLNRDHVRSEDDRCEEDILIRSNNFIYSHLLVNVSSRELFFKTLFRVITFLKSDEDVTVVAVLVCISLDVLFCSRPSRSIHARRRTVE